MNRPVPLRVWVPPGRTPVVSPGVEVQWILTEQENLIPVGAERPGDEEQAQGGAVADPWGRKATGLAGRRGADAADRRLRAAPERRGVGSATPGDGRTRRGGAEPGPGVWSGRALPGRPDRAPGRAPRTADLEADGPGDVSELSYLTPELLALADEVMSQYPMKVSGMQFITAKPDKGGAIWRIETDHGPRSLKQLHRPARRSLFSVGAQEYLVSRGARVPALIKTRDGQLAVEREGKLWIVTDWVEPLVPASKVDLAGAQALCYGLGEFHMHSRGYVPPPGAQKSSRLYKWPNAYRKISTKIGWFRQLALAYPEMEASPIILAVVDEFEAQARRAAERLEASPYKSLAARGEPAWGLVHQDKGAVQRLHGRMVTGVPVGTRR